MARNSIATTVAVWAVASDTTDPAIITSVAPTAVMPTNAVEARIARTLSTVANRGVVTASATSTSSRTASPAADAVGRRPTGGDGCGSAAPGTGGAVAAPRDESLRVL